MAKVFNIQRYSIHDGPGIRTTVFFKGCPLKCIWCHNPESQKFDKEIMIYKDRCISCGYCIKSCKNKAIDNYDNCTLCEECTENCPTNARQIVGKEMTITDIINEIQKDRIFFDQSKGGVTLSGGEPLSQGVFLKDLVVELKSKRINIILDTSGYSKWEVLENIAPYIDLFLYDLKVVNNEKHKKYTGVSNEIIIENLKKLSTIGKEIFIRIPIIPSLNDSEEDIQDFINLLKEVKNFNHIDLLPYHNISMEKYKRLGVKYDIEHVKKPTKEQMESIRDKFQNEGFRVKIGGIENERKS